MRGPTKPATCFISGGMSGLGCALASEYLKRGSNVAIFDLALDESVLRTLENQRVRDSQVIAAFQVDVTDAEALLEVVGEAGLFFNPRSVEEMIDRIRVVLEDSTLRQKMVEEGLDRARLFSWEKTARKVVGVYRELLER